MTIPINEDIIIGLATVTNSGEGGGKQKKYEPMRNL